MNRKCYPEIVTYAGTKDQVVSSLNSGADHLILEDAKLSLRSHLDHIASKDFFHIIELADLARSINSKVKLSFNLDILAKEKDFQLIKELLTVLSQAKIKIVRIQDPGLSVFIRQIVPDIEMHLATETGNFNSESIAYFSTIFQRQILANELTYDELQMIVNNINTEFEIQVQGPILIQESARKYLSWYGKKNKISNADQALVKKNWIIDLDHLQRMLTLYENRHGSFCYLDNDKCLFKNLDKLKNLKLSGWLIDGRGESKEYLENALLLYKQAKDDLFRDSFKPDKKIFNMLKQNSKRPFTVGFFLENNTDIYRRNIFFDNDSTLENNSLVGTVLDVIKGKLVTIELTNNAPNVTNGMILYAINPENKRFSFKVKDLQDLENKALVSTKGLDFVTVKWHKGIQPRTKLSLEFK